MDERAAEELFRHKVLALLRGRGLLSEERIELLLSWRRSGFSVHNRVWAHPGQGREFEALVRYMNRSPVSLKRLRSAPGSKEVVNTRKGRHDAAEPTDDEKIDAEECVARVLVQIPEPRRHLVRYYAAYSNRARGQRRKAEEKLEAHGSSEPSHEPVPTPGAGEGAAGRAVDRLRVARDRRDGALPRSRAATCRGAIGVATRRARRVRDVREAPMLTGESSLFDLRSWSLFSVFGDGEQAGVA